MVERAGFRLISERNSGAALTVERVNCPVGASWGARLLLTIDLSAGSLSARVGGEVEEEAEEGCVASSLQSGMNDCLFWHLQASEGTARLSSLLGQGVSPSPEGQLVP